MTTMNTYESDAPAFEETEEKWFETRRESRRPSQRPPSYAPPSIEDSIADGWFRDV